MKWSGDRVINALALLVVVAVMGAACALLTSCSPPPGPVPVVVPEGTCEAAGARLEELQCVAEGVELWFGFADACRVAMTDGEDWHPGCLAALTSCADVDRVWLGGCL